MQRFDKNGIRVLEVRKFETVRTTTATVNANTTSTGGFKKVQAKEWSDASFNVWHDAMQSAGVIKVVEFTTIRELKAEVKATEAKAVKALVTEKGGTVKAIRRAEKLLELAKSTKEEIVAIRRAQAKQHEELQRILETQKAIQKKVNFWGGFANDMKVIIADLSQEIAKLLLKGGAQYKRLVKSLKVAWQSLKDAARNYIIGKNLLKTGEQLIADLA
jgi:hypothetical protein